MKCKQLALRVLSTAAILSIVSSIAAPVFAETYYIGNGYDLSIEAKEDGKVYVNGHEDQDGEITIKGSAGKDSLTEEKKEQETGENSGAEKQTVTEETPKEKTSAEEGETKKQDTPSENSDEENEGKDPANENKKDDAPAAEENDPQPEDTAEPEEKAVKKEAADSGENAPAALQSTAAAKSAPEKNTSVEKSPVSNVIKVVNNWKNNILKITLDNVNIKVDKKEDKAAMSVSGSGDTEINLKGNNVLDSTVSSGHAGLEKADTLNPAGEETGNDGKLIITACDNEQNLTAKGARWAAGIGGRANGVAHSKAEITGIEINGGKIYAEGDSGGEMNNDGGGAGIGGGSWTIGKVTINGGDITAIGGVDGGAGIGGGKNNAGFVTINGGDITATGGAGGGAGIGGGKSGAGFVTINGGDITATGGNDEGCGVGSGKWGRNSNININGGNVTASSTLGGAGIGGTYSKVTIASGNVHAAGGASGKNSSGILGGGAGIGGYGADVTITGGNVTATGTEGGAGIGTPGGKNDSNIAPGTIKIGGKAQVAATGGSAVSNNTYNYSYNAGAAIGNGSAPNSNVKGEEVEVVTDNSTTATIVRNPAGTSADHQHTWKVTSHKDATTEHPGETVYHCACGADRTDYSPALPDNGTNSYAPLTVLGADSFEQTTENDRLIITVPEESASLTGSLAALRELESSGIRTLVFRTRHCESSVRLADLTAQGSDEAVFVLSHSGENASLTLDGRDLTSLLA